MPLAKIKKESRKMSKLYLNSDLFFLLKDEGIVLWDYQKHQQFSLNSSYFERLIAYSQGKEDEADEASADIDHHLVKEGILVPQAPTQPSWNWDKLSYIFHIGTRNVVNDEHTSKEEWIADYVAGCEEAIERKIEDIYVKRKGVFFPLPSPNLELLNQRSFQEILQQRQTVRNFDGQPVSLEAFSTLIFTTFGLFHGPWHDLTEAGLRELGVRKTSASGGGLHPNEAFITIHNVVGIEPGTYHYDVERHGLVSINNALSDDELSAFCMGQPFGEGLAFGVFIVAFFAKLWWKYPHSRGYRVALLDAGHLSQTFQLVATSLGILSWMTANIHDVNVSSHLKLDGVHQAPLHFLGAGYGQKSAVYKGFREYFEK
ncbi:MAG: SagB/ThcOx family dehydrogenase [Alphaproteobacteria bacterium]|nr:SagB/ThcOx family dehydrogenase [Alphaproteobacteria bacterium]